MSFPRYNEYQDSGLSWLGQVPTHWSLRRLGYYFGERREKVSDRDYQPLSVTKYGIVPQLETAAKTDDGDNRKKVCKGDFVINSRSDRKGSAGLSGLDGSVSLISTVLKPKESVHGPFVHHLLRCTPFQEEFYRFGKGIVADLWSTNYASMSGITLAMPPLSEQHGIATFLDRETAKIDALIAEQQRLIELLQEKRQSVISHAVTKGLNPDAPMKDSGVEWLGEVPEHWEIKNIGLVTERITYGFTNPMPTEEEGPYMLTANDIENGRIRFDTCRRTSESAFTEELTDKSRPVTGDILLTKDGTLGRVALYTEKDNAACINQSIALLRPSATDCLGAFLATALSSDCYQEKMLFDAGGTTIKHIYISRLAKMPVAIPPTVEQEEILQHLEVRTRPYELLVADSVASLTLLRERRSALISAAVTGQIDVRGLATEEAA